MGVHGDILEEKRCGRQEEPDMDKQTTVEGKAKTKTIEKQGMESFSMKDERGKTDKMKQRKDLETGNMVKIKPHGT